LNSCRAEYDSLKQEASTKDRKIDELKSELDKLQAANKISKKTTKPVKKKSVVKTSTKDDLTLISGVGPKLQEKMYKEGITHLEQIAAWKAADIREFDEKLFFKGRIKRDEWVKQAKALLKK